MATSNARNVHLESEQPSALDQHPVVRRYFEQASAAEPPVERQQANDQAEGRGSQMVKDDRPQPELKPDGELAQGVDREAFNEKWAAEREMAQSKLIERYESSVEEVYPVDRDIQNEI